MADTVRYLLEEMVPELEDMEQRGYFSRAEIKQIVQKRQDFEYNLKRRAALKEDYLRYVEYESRLEQLRQHRRKERGITGKKSLADYCITRRIHFIYDRATRKFRGDLALWSRWLFFCQRSGSSRQLSRALTKALQLHPTAPSLWTYAAAWEFEHNLNASAARALMQRGLRMCKEAPALWHEYFRMELLYAMRLRERRRVLGIEDADTTIAGDGEGEEGADGQSDESAAAVNMVLNGAVAAVVYRSAVKAVPGSVEFRGKFLNIMSPFEFPGKSELEELVFSSMEEDFPGSPQAWDLRARRSLNAAEAGAAPSSSRSNEARQQAVRAAVEVYRQGVEAVPSKDMYSVFAAFLREQLQGVLHEEHEARGRARSKLQEQGSQLAEQLLEVYAQAASGGHLTQEMALEWPKLQLRRGSPSGALDAALSAARTLSSSPAVWQQLVALESCLRAHSRLVAGDAELAGAIDSAAPARPPSDSSSEDDVQLHSHEDQQLEQLVLKALRSVGVEEGISLWLTGLQTLVGCGASLEGLCRLLLKMVAGLARGPVEGGMGAVAAAVLAAVEHTNSLEEARKLYRELFKLPPAGGELMHAVIDMELAAEGGGAALAGNALSAQQLREVFEVAVGAYGEQDWKLWLRYMQYEQQHSRGVGQLYWRAVKALANPQPFITECQLQETAQ